LGLSACTFANTEAKRLSWIAQDGLGAKTSIGSSYVSSAISSCLFGSGVQWQRSRTRDSHKALGIIF